ncbi:MAG: response regulator [Cyanobacteria bacterium SZAS LIN-3]|nr:response regulator [Cyanobacteria bacterium SZAS LIN-3]
MTGRIQLLLVEDSQADARLILEVFKDERVAVDVHVVRDGEEAMHYLCRSGTYRHARRPDVVLLDLNLPKKDGREVLAEMKASADLNSIPVLILTTSQSEEDIVKSYKLQASCYIPKPMDLEQFSSIIKSLDQFWFHNVRYPSKK